MPLPRLIALCGHPKSGKSEAQIILQKTLGYQPVDDGEALRAFAINQLGLSITDVYTQEGKSRYTEILDKSWQNRDILGTLGKQLEDMFGEHIMPWMAMRKLDPTKRYSFGSVRKNQGIFFKRHGGIVMEIKNPDAKSSRYEFDKYNTSIIDIEILNDALNNGLPVEEAREDLQSKIITALNYLSHERQRVA
jgi:hypothetical protein